MMELDDALAALKRARRDGDVVITTMAASKVWMDMWDGGGGPHPLDFVFVPSCMSHATSYGLGIALAQPTRRVLVCNGDGSMLMNLGSLASIAAAAPKNLVVLLFDNGVYEVTGSQPVPCRTDFDAIARGSGLKSVYRFTDLDDWRRRIDDVLSAPGPVFVWLDIEARPSRPAPKSPGNAAARAAALRSALGTSTASRSPVASRPPHGSR